MKKLSKKEIEAIYWAVLKRGWKIMVEYDEILLRSKESGLRYSLSTIVDWRKW